MAFLRDRYREILAQCIKSDVTLVAVSKLRTVNEIQDAYDEGQRDFGENYVQELMSKYEVLPKDIRWHFIGHMQTNKVKYIAPFVFMIQGIDNDKSLREVDRQAKKAGTKIKCLLQVHISNEETKFGFSEEDLKKIDLSLYPGADVCGLMGMASFSDDEQLVRSEFLSLKKLFDEVQTRYPFIKTLSMGMSGDYMTAIKCGSNMIRVGSSIFGARPVK